MQILVQFRSPSHQGFGGNVGPCASMTAAFGAVAAVAWFPGCDPEQAERTDASARITIVVILVIMDVGGILLVS